MSKGLTIQSHEGNYYFFSEKISENKIKLSINDISGSFRKADVVKIIEFLQKSL